MAVKMNKINPKKNALGRFVAILVAVAVMGGLMIWVTSQNTEFQKTVSVVMWNSPISVSEIIRDDGKQLKKYDMYYKEFMNYGTYEDNGEVKRSIVLWDEREQLFGKYAATFQRSGTVAFWDNLVSNKEHSNTYLYKIKNKEFLKMQGFAPSEYGEILVPGDHINVRVAYEDVDYTLPPEELVMLQQQNTEPPKVIKREMLFSDVAIVDMLNGSGESIFDAFYELMALPATQREEMVNSDEFKTRVSPDSYLLALTPEQIDKYVYIMKKSGITITVTILPRTEDSIILDYLRDIVRSSNKTVQ